MSEDEFKRSIAIVMPAEHRDSNPGSHCTVMYLGEIGDVDFTKSQVELVVEKLRKRWGQLFISNGIHVWNRGYSCFGQERDKLVAILPADDERIGDIHDHAEYYLGHRGIKSASNFDYRPHVTLGVAKDINTMYLPNSQLFTLYKPVLWWGDERPKR